MVTCGGGGDSGREKLGWGLGKVEEVLGKMLAQGIDVWWPEEGDRRKGGNSGASGRAELVSGRCEEKKEEMTAGARNQINIWVLPGRTVHRSRADRLGFPGCYN